MIVGLVYRLLNLVLIALTCLYVQVLERDVVGFSQQFAADQHVRVCGHLLAFEANAEAALRYLGRHWALDGAEIPLRDWVDEARPRTDCGDLDLHLYRQIHEDLPRDYPNYWFRV